MVKRNIKTVLDNSVASIHDGIGICHGGRVMDHFQLGLKAWRFIDIWRIPPGTSIGEHLHINGRELYFIIRGSATMICNGKKIRVAEGDMIINEPGDSHGFENTSHEDVVVMVTMVLDGNDEILSENL